MGVFSKSFPVSPTPFLTPVHFRPCARATKSSRTDTAGRARRAARVLISGSWVCLWRRGSWFYFGISGSGSRRGRSRRGRRRRGRRRRSWLASDTNRPLVWCNVGSAAARDSSNTPEIVDMVKYVLPQEHWYQIYILGSRYYRDIIEIL